MVLEKHVACDWESVHYWAAKHRLDLARRYQHQYERLDREFPNLRASRAWVESQAGEEAAHLLIGYVEALAAYLRQRGLDAELLHWCEDALQACSTVGQNPDQLLLLRSEAQIALGRWDEAVASIQAAVEASEGKNPRSYAQAVLVLGRLQLNRDNYKDALETLGKAEALCAEQSDYEGMATVRSEVAAYHLNRRELDEALSLYLEVDQLRRQAGATEASDNTLLMLGVIHRKKGDYGQAIAYLKQLLERGEMQRNRGATARAVHHLAWVYLNQGGLTQARRFSGRAITLYEEIGDTRGASDTYEQLGLIALAEGRTGEAYSYLEWSLAMRRQLGNRVGAASSLRRLAIVRFRTGHPVGAMRDLWESLTIYRRLGVLSCQQLVAILWELTAWMIGPQQWTV